MGLIIGLIASIIGTAVTISVPYIERFIDNLLGRTLAMFGISLFTVGFFLQSLIYGAKARQFNNAVALKQYLDLKLDHKKE